MARIHAKLMFAIPLLVLTTMLVLGASVALGQTALVITATADLDMTTSNGYCRPNLESMSVDNDIYSAMLFDISSLPEGAIITTANLQLVGANTNSHAARIYAVATFNPATTYDCISIDGAVGPVAWSLPSSANVAIESPDITSLMTAAENGVIGLIITGGEDVISTNKLFWSSEYSDGEYTPELILEYAMPTAVPTPSPTPSPTPIIFATAVYSLPGGTFTDTYEVTAPGEPFPIESLPDPLVPLDVTEVFSFQSLNYMISTARSVPRLITRLPGYRYLVWLVVIVVSISVFMRMRAAAKTSLGSPRVNAEGKEL